MIFLFKLNKTTQLLVAGNGSLWIFNTYVNLYFITKQLCIE